MKSVVIQMGLALVLCAAAPAAAAPRTINDCEAIKEPNAYNLCLASFGPVRGQHGATYPGVATEGGKGADKGADKGAETGAGTGGPEKGAEAASPARARHGGRHGRWHGRFGGYRARGTHAANGRVRMEFSPGQ
jgi:hypothetical protein